MKVQFQEESQLKEVEVSVLYPKWSEEVEQLKHCLNNAQRCLSGDDNGRKYSIPIFSIYYIESMERKTFIYTKDQVYRSMLSLNSLTSSLPEKDFTRISKSCLLNINVLESIRVLPNSKLEALLDNGEKVIVTRNYLNVIREKLEG